MATSMLEDVAMASSNGTRPGWFNDGQTPGFERWWDGNSWTDATRPTPAPKRSRYVWRIVGVAVVAFLALGLWSAVSQSSSRSASPPDPSTTRSDYQPISDRDLDFIVKDPESERGRRLSLLATVYQLDTRTGESSMLVDAYADSWDTSPTRMVVDVTDPSLLAPLVEGDSVEVFVEVWGVEEYETVAGVKRADPRVIAGIIEQR